MLGGGPVAESIEASRSSPVECDGGEKTTQRKPRGFISAAEAEGHKWLIIRKL